MSKNLQLFKPYYRTEEILELIRECCDIGWTGIGGKMLDFEEEWKSYSKAKTCHMVSSATSGLHLAFMQLKMKEEWEDGDEVITTPLTFVSSNHAILYNNLKPVFADIDEYGCLDTGSVEKLITEKTRAILFVGLGGNTGNLSAIIKVAKKNNLKLILDAAHMSGTKWKDNNRQVGCDNRGIDVSIFSGQAVKNLPTADSGWVCWNNKEAKEMDTQIRKLSWLGIDRDTFSRTNSQGSYKWYYDVPYLGFKAHSNAIMGCFGLVGLKYLEQDNAYRRYLCELYENYLEDNENIQIIPTSPDCISSRHLFQVKVENRDEVMLALNQSGIYPGVHYRENTIYSMFSYAKGTCSEAEEFSKKVISLPLHLYLKPSDIEYICDKLKGIVNK